MNVRGRVRWWARRVERCAQQPAQPSSTRFRSAARLEAALNTPERLPWAAAACALPCARPSTSHAAAHTAGGTHHAAGPADAHVAEPRGRPITGNCAAHACQVAQSQVPGSVGARAGPSVADAAVAPSQLVSQAATGLKTRPDMPLRLPWTAAACALPCVRY